MRILRGSGHQAAFEQARILGVEVFAEFGRLRFIGLEGLRAGTPLLERRGRTQAGARTQDGREAREAEPGFVPQEQQVRLDGEAFLHHPPRVVHVAVERAVRQRQHLQPIEASLRLEIEQGLLDRAQRHGAVHRVFRHRKGFDVQRLASRQHHPVVVRLVAVAVRDHDVAGLGHRLVDHLVGRRRAVGHEEHVVGADRARKLLLRHFDVAGRLEHAVDAAGRGGRLGQEQVLAVELAHVADPVRLHDRLAARDRQRVEGGDRPGSVMLEIVEERRGVAVGDAFDDVEVHLEQFLDLVEHAADHRGSRIARQLLHVAVGQQVDVEFRSHTLDRRAPARPRRRAAPGSRCPCARGWRGSRAAAASRVSKGSGFRRKSRRPRSCRSG